MRRPTRGATTHPALARPGMGYGRPLRARPAPVARVDLDAALRGLLRGDIEEIEVISEIEVIADRSSVTPTDSRS